MANCNDREKKARVVLGIGCAVLVISIWSQRSVFSNSGTMPAASAKTAVASQGETAAAAPISEPMPSQPVPVTETTSEPASDAPPADPFRPSVSMESGETASVMPQTGVRPPRVSVSLPPMLPEQVSEHPAPVVHETSKEAAKPVLKGIIGGKRSLAVIEYGDRVYYARTGEAIGRGLVVSSIQSDHVVLIQRTRLGGDMPGDEGPVTLSVEGGQE